jgi:hypothetical protein
VFESISINRKKSAKQNPGRISVDAGTKIEGKMPAIIIFFKKILMSVLKDYLSMKFSHKKFHVLFLKEEISLSVNNWSYAIYKILCRLDLKIQP